LFGFSYIIYVTFFAAYLVREGGWSQAAAGGLWAQIGLVSIISGFIWGAVSDRWGRRFGLAMVFGIQGLCYLVFAVVKSPLGFYLSALLFASTSWSIPAIVAAACGDYLGPRLAPAALGLATVLFGIGQAIGPGISGYIADITGSFSLAFLVAATAALVGSIGSLLLRPIRPGSQAQKP
jgi:MFS family permease